VRAWTVRLVVLCAVVSGLVSLAVAMACSGPGPAGGDYVVGSQTLSSASWIRAANGVLAGGNLTGTAEAGVLRFASGLFSGTVEANAISVTTGITVATLAVDGGVVVTGEVQALNGLQVAGNLTGGAGSVLRYGVGLISGTLSANAIGVTTGITVATLKVAGSGQVTGELTAGNGILAGGTGITGTGAGGGAVLMGYGAFTVQVSSALVVSTGMIRAATSATQTVINTQPITPVGSYMRLAAAVAVFTSKVITSLASIGDLCVLQNIGTPSITITDGSYCNLVSTFALGISDTLGLVFDGKLWVEIFRSNN